MKITSTYTREIVYMFMAVDVAVEDNGWTLCSSITLVVRWVLEVEGWCRLEWRGAAAGTAALVGGGSGGGAAAAGGCGGCGGGDGGLGCAALSLLANEEGRKKAAAHAQDTSGDK